MRPAPPIPEWRRKSAWRKLLVNPSLTRLSIGETQQSFLIQVKHQFQGDNTNTATMKHDIWALGWLQRLSYADAISKVGS